MPKKLFVGGLSWGTTDDQLRETFEAHGEVVEAKVITDRITGRSRGFGFVTFSEEDAAMAAISTLDGSTLDGRTIKVNVAMDRKPRRDSAPRGGSRNNRGSRGWY